MANQEHLDILRHGVEVWNEWRREHSEIQPDLREASLRGANLQGANFREANFNAAILVNADLSDVDFTRACLDGAQFHSANLRGANLSCATCTYTMFVGSNLSGANLLFTNFTLAFLVGANLHEALLGDTTFAGIDLCSVEGLDTVVHDNPSCVDVKTVQLPEGYTRIHFLRGVGFSDAFIEYLPSLLTTAIQYASCFVSYAHQDEALARRLCKDLQDRRVRCWFAPENMKIGDKIRARIDEAIRLHDKLLLILSQHSVSSQWVEQEVETALAKERKENRVVLFPLRLDNTVMDVEEGWPAFIRNTRNISDFTHWEQDDAYQRALERLLRDLKAEQKSKE